MTRAMSYHGLSRRGFIKLAGAGAALAGLSTATIVHAEPQSADAVWIGNHLDTRLIGPDGQAIVGLPRWTHMRVLAGLPNGQMRVWVPRFNLTGLVAANTIGPVPAPSPGELDAEKLDGPPL